MWPVRSLMLALALTGWGWLYERDQYEARFWLIGPSLELRAFADKDTVLTVGRVGEWGWFAWWEK